MMKLKNIKDATNGEFETWQRVCMLMGLNKWTLNVKDEKLEEREDALKKKVKKEKKKEADLPMIEQNKKLQEKEKLLDYIRSITWSYWNGY